MTAIAGDDSQAGVWQRLMLHVLKSQLGTEDKALLRDVLDVLSTNPEARTVLAPLKAWVEGGREADAGLLDKATKFLLAPLKDLVESKRDADPGFLDKAAEFLTPRVLGYTLVKEVLGTVGIGLADFHQNEIVRQASSALFENGINLRLRFLHDIDGEAKVPGVARSELESFAEHTARDKSGFQKGVIAVLLHRKVLDDALKAGVTLPQGVNTGTTPQRQAVKFLVIAALRQFFMSMGLSGKALDEAGIRWDAEAEKTGGTPLEYYIGPNGTAKTLANIKGYPLTPDGEKPAVTEKLWPIATGEVSDADRQMADLVTWVGMELRVFRELKRFKRHQRIRRAASDTEERPARMVIGQGREMLKLLDPEPRQAGKDELEGAKTVYEFANDVEVALFDALPDSELNKTAELLKSVQTRNEASFNGILSLTDADSWNSLVNVFEGYHTQLRDTYYLMSKHGEKKEAAMALATIAHWLSRDKDVVSDIKVLDLLYKIHIILKDTVLLDEVSGEIIHFGEYLTGEQADPETRTAYQKHVFPYMEREKRRAAQETDLKEKRPAMKPTGTDPLWEQPLGEPSGPAGTNFIYGNYFAKLDLNTMLLYVPRGDWYINNPFAIAALLAYVVEVVRASDPAGLLDAVHALRRIEDRLEEEYREANGKQSLPVQWTRLSDILNRARESKRVTSAAPSVD